MDKKSSDETRCSSSPIASTEDPIIEGLVKFRDGKKWKSRWCVMRKLSPVADSVHLQLYRDANARQKLAQTKASLSLENFLGLESGFHLDKESHTLAVLCKGLVAVLAFPAHETLLAWRVRVARALGEGRYVTGALLVTAPAKSKIHKGPVKLHARDGAFCLTAGVPPKIIGIFEISDLRRYGVVDGKVCFEGGSRCGKLAGAWALLTDRPDKLVEALVAASPKHGKNSFSMQSSFDEKKRFSGNDSCVDPFDLGAANLSSWNLDSSYQSSDVASSIGDSVSILDIQVPPNILRNSRTRHASLGRCVSCMSNLGRPTIKPMITSIPTHSWGADSVFERRSDSDRASLCSRSSGTTSEYSTSRSSCIEAMLNSSSLILPPTPNVPPKMMSYGCQCKSIARKKFAGPYENYDVPKPPQPLNNDIKSESYYDKPKNLRRCLLKSETQCNCSKTFNVINEDVVDNTDHSARRSIESQGSIEKLLINTLHSSNHSNYVNIEPILEESCEKLFSESTNDLSATLQDFESSAQILKNAGFSQDEIDELEDLTIVEDNNCNDTKLLETQQIVTPHHNNYLFMHPLETFTLPKRTQINNTNSIMDGTLTKRKSSSAEFLKEAETFLDIYRSSSHKNVSVDLMPLRRNTGNLCVNDKCENCLKSCAKQSSEEKLPKIHTKINNDNFTVANVNIFVERDLNTDKLQDTVKIRRSSSVPSKSENRDSSSSDSGVSTGSLKHHKYDCVDLESTITNTPPCNKHRASFKSNRKTKMISGSTVSNVSDPMQQIHFQFDKDLTLVKSKSCDTSTVCFRKHKGSISSDTRGSYSPSSCSSEDYIETLSLSSISSNEVCSRSTRRPRSGREYSTILPVQCALQSSCTKCQTLQPA